MSIDVLTQDELPEGFCFPDEYLKVVKLNLVDLNPWGLMNHESAVWRIEGMAERYPKRQLIPFARRYDNDDVACFEVGKENKVQIIHDFASPGYEQRETFDTFWDWFREAIEAMIEFD